MKRSLTVEWQDPGTLADAARTLSGILYAHATTTCMVLANGR